MPTVPITNNTLGQMKSDIATEMGRGTALDAIIPSKIMEAIEFYQAERFWFSETRDITFNTVQGQEFYGAADNANIPTLQYIDYVILYLGSIPWIIHRTTDKEIEVLNQNGLVQGQPWNWSYFNEQLRLGPIPSAVYSMRIACHRYVTPPANDTEANNPWMTNAERMIRCKTKFFLHVDVLRNTEEAQKMDAAAQEAHDMLVGKTNRLLGRGIMAPMEF